MVITGVWYALVLTAAGVLTGYFTKTAWLGAPFLLLALFCLWFFRDPDRVVPGGPVAVSPADGKVVSISKDPDGRTRLCIFLNVFDVHVNRSPIAGTITKRIYKPGKFLVASKDEASTENEQNTFVVEDNGVSVEFSQIAGLIARRIVWYKDVGDKVEKGERVGLIKFGSRVDLLFNSDWKLTVSLGERVSAASSIIAKRVQ
ncbi:phosphatidylserine decarboxylase [Bryobacter aggregatus]|uniref:phosphatidylserine decarboxylase n=1 Tax=Bryobacter aggregatus TaxID=360054 RepID=UPI0004E0FDF9|nr:phosphatidylserine decarboxylase [Bryobacter aggregatus]